MNNTSGEYQIRIKGQLDLAHSAWLDGFSITHTSDGDTLLTGKVVDQAALHGIIARCRNLGITLISINPVDVDQIITIRENTMSNANPIKVAASAVIDARPETLYAIISDYRVGHPAILPKPYFTDLVVEKGGQGAGTVMTVKLKVWGQVSIYHQIVSEPEPGHVILETEMNTGQFSSFTFEPLNGGEQTRLTIYSEFPASRGLKGWLERLTMPGIAGKIYHKELDNIAEYVRSPRSVPSMG
ncbi:MAG TPA: SRPBCC family protein [Phototrophicaceae bacterium]|nr:SRPBCC family protein [Phototrophicaceae bacterium]